MPQYKRHHFVPQFYLRYFSHDRNGKRISVFNIPSSLFVPVSSLRTQAYKNHLYGKAPENEIALGWMEGPSAKAIAEIKSTGRIPQSTSAERSTILIFTLFLHTRTGYAGQSLDEAMNKAFRSFFRADPRIGDKADEIRIGFDDPTTYAMGLAAQSWYLAADLDLKLITNKSQIPFISSDNPAVCYNQFLEPRRVIGSNTGIGSLGLQIFLPISPEHCLVFYDGGIYKCGGRRESNIVINNEQDAIQLNLLQYAAAQENLYCHQPTFMNLTRILEKVGQRFRRVRKATKFEYKNFIDENGQPGTLQHVYREDVRCNLKLSFLTLQKRAKLMDVTSRLVHLRNPRLCEMHSRYIDEVHKGRWGIGQFPEYVRSEFVSG